MTETSESMAYTTIGLAVLACQDLEIAFALVVKLAFKYPPGTSVEDIEPLEKNFTKDSMRYLLKMLRTHIDVSEEFGEKLIDIIDRRNILIHRWSVQYGAPVSEEDYSKLVAFAYALNKDVMGATRLLHEHMSRWLKQLPGVDEALKAVDPWLIPPGWNISIEREGDD